MELPIEEAIQRIAERTVDNTTELRKARFQRRTEFTDLYGIPFSAQGDANSPATFYISISPDLVYYLRFQFKLEIKPFVSTVSAGTRPASVVVNPTSLAGQVSGQSVNITPNPHGHDTNAHTHEVVSGLTITHTEADDFRMMIQGIDITAYLMEQHDGAWIEGEGLYPNNVIEGEDDFYDILDVATVLHSEGNTADCEKLLAPGFKKVEITSNSPFAATLYLYVKHSNMGR